MSFSGLSSFDPGSMTMGLTWLVVGIVVMYFGRVPGHRAVLTLSRVLERTFRLSASSVVKAEQRLSLRNREVLLASGREAAERIIDREFERVEAVVRRDVAAVPAIERQLQERLTRIEEDYQQSTEVPPEPPGWASVVEAVAKVSGKGDPMIAGLLHQIRDSLVKAQEQAVADYRTAMQNRHAHLKRMMPEWRKMQELASKANANVVKVLERANVIDRHMDDYDHIIKGTDRALRTLSTSSLQQFLISALVLAIAIGGAVINFQLIARPMAEMVGGNSTIGNFKTADIAALVIILVEISIGLFLMESMRITRLFPMIGALPDKIRLRMLWITFSILLSLACVEAGLAYMREILLQDALATNAVLRGAGSAIAADYAWITTAAQMGMGFILPFALVFAIIPLENFVFSVRTVTGIVFAGLLRSFAATLLLLSGAAHTAGEFIVNVYDVAIFVPLWFEGAFKSSKRGAGKSPANVTVKEALP